MTKKLKNLVDRSSCLDLDWQNLFGMDVLLDFKILFIFDFKFRYAEIV